MAKMSQGDYEDGKLVAPLVSPIFEKAAADGLFDTAMDSTMETIGGRLTWNCPNIAR